MRFYRTRAKWHYYKKSRYRKGYGVHSPFAFYLITRIFEEKYPYYAYAEIEELRARLKKAERRDCLPVKEAQLLFRLLNYVQPYALAEFGRSDGMTTRYIERACVRVHRQSDLNKSMKQICSDAASEESTLLKTTVAWDSITENRRDPDPEKRTLQRLAYFSTAQLSDFKEWKNPSCLTLFYDNLNTEMFEKSKEAFLAYLESVEKIRTRKDYPLLVYVRPHASILSEKRWQEMLQLPYATLSVETFNLGMVFFHPELESKHYMLRF